jgi:hypothetical protein
LYKTTCERHERLKSEGLKLMLCIVLEKRERCARLYNELKSKILMFWKMAGNQGKAVHWQ